jgi:hypothetical protein
VVRQNLREAGDAEAGGVGAVERVTRRRAMRGEGMKTCALAGTLVSVVEGPRFSWGVPGGLPTQPPLPPRCPRCPRCGGEAVQPVGSAPLWECERCGERWPR